MKRDVKGTKKLMARLTFFNLGVLLMTGIHSLIIQDIVPMLPFFIVFIISCGIRLVHEMVWAGFGDD